MPSKALDEVLALTYGQSPEAQEVEEEGPVRPLPSPTKRRSALAEVLALTWEKPTGKGKPAAKAAAKPTAKPAAEEAALRKLLAEEARRNAAEWSVEPLSVSIAPGAEASLPPEIVALARQPKPLSMAPRTPVPEEYLDRPLPRRPGVEPGALLRRKPKPAPSTAPTPAPRPSIPGARGAGRDILTAAMRGVGQAAAPIAAATKRAFPDAPSPLELDAGIEASPALAYTKQTEDSLLRRMALQGLESFVGSSVMGLPFGAAAAAGGAAKRGILGAALIGPNPEMGYSEYETALEEMTRAGVPEAEARRRAGISAAAEMGFETLGDVLELPALAGGGSLAGRYLKSLLGVELSQVPTEVATTAVQVGQRKAAGLPAPDMKQALKETALSTLLAGPLFAAAGPGGEMAQRRAERTTPKMRAEREEEARTGDVARAQERYHKLAADYRALYDRERAQRAVGRALPRPEKRRLERLDREADRAYEELGRAEQRALGIEEGRQELGYLVTPRLVTPTGPPTPALKAKAEPLPIPRERATHPGIPEGLVLPPERPTPAPAPTRQPPRPRTGPDLELTPPEEPETPTTREGVLEGIVRGARETIRRQGEIEVPGVGPVTSPHDIGRTGGRLQAWNGRAWTPVGFDEEANDGDDDELDELAQRAGVPYRMGDVVPKEESFPEETPTPEETPEEPDADDPFARRDIDHNELAGALKEDFLAGVAHNRISLRKKIAVLFGQKPEEVGQDERSLKDIEETVEEGLVRAVRAISGLQLTQDQKWERIKAVYDRQPRLETRTGDRIDEEGNLEQGSISRQAYSTPVHLAWALNEWATRGKPKTYTFEGTAGHGALLTGTDAHYGIANELDKRRARSLAMQGLRVTNEDARGWLKRHPEWQGAAEAVIMNPPFGERQGEENIDHEIALQHLQALAPGGRAVVVMGGHYTDKTKTHKDPDPASKHLLTQINQNYNLTHVIEVARQDMGRLYGKQGAAYPISILVIEGRRDARDSSRIYPRPSEVEYATSVDQIRDILQRGEANDLGKPGLKRGGGGAPTGNTPGTGVTPGGVEPTGTGSTPSGTPPGGSDTGTDTGPGTGGGAPPGGREPGGSGSPGRVEGSDEEGGGSGDTPGSDEPAPLTDRQKRIREILEKRKRAGSGQPSSPSDDSTGSDEEEGAGSEPEEYHVPQATLDRYSRTYSGDTIGEQGRIRGVFEHDGRQWVVTGTHGVSPGVKQATAHQVIPLSEWRNPTDPGTRKTRGGYHGRKVTLRGKEYVLSNPDVTFYPEEEPSPAPEPETPTEPAPDLSRWEYSGYHVKPKVEAPIPTGGPRLAGPGEIVRPGDTFDYIVPGRSQQQHRYSLGALDRPDGSVYVREKMPLGAWQIFGSRADFEEKTGMRLPPEGYVPPGQERLDEAIDQAAERVLEIDALALPTGTKPNSPAAKKLYQLRARKMEEAVREVTGDYALIPLTYEDALRRVLERAGIDALPTPGPREPEPLKPPRQPRPPRTGGTKKPPGKKTETPAPTPTPAPSPTEKPETPAPRRDVDPRNVGKSLSPEAKAKLEALRKALEGRQQESGERGVRQWRRKAARAIQRQTLRDDPDVYASTDATGAPTSSLDAKVLRLSLDAAHTMFAEGVDDRRLFGRGLLQMAGERVRPYLVAIHKGMGLWPEGEEFDSELMDLVTAEAVDAAREGTTDQAELGELLANTLGEEVLPFVPAIHAAVSAWPGIQSVGEEGMQTMYLARSMGPASLSLVPIRMAVATEKALDELAEEVGDLDQWVADQLGYGTPEKLWTHASGADRFNAGQIDSIALAIASHRGNRGMIIGHQTGQGKGRIGAAMLRWARLQGKRPVFLTRDATLFSELWADWNDITDPDDALAQPTIYVFNAREGDAIIRNAPEGDAVTGKAYKGALHFAKGEAAPEHDLVFTTYSQFNRALLDEKGKETPASMVDRIVAWERDKKNGRTKEQVIADLRPNTPKQHRLVELARDNHVILDESHSSAGESNTGYLFQKVTDKAAGVTYLSATYAKSPEAMAVYSKTSLGKFPGIKEALRKGGVAIQQVVARMLSEAGEMLRLEMDASEIHRFDRLADEERGAEHEKLLDGATAILREIVGMDKLGARAVEAIDDPTVSSRKVEDLVLQPASIQFNSVAHYLVQQALLSLKMDAVVEEAIRAHRGLDRHDASYRGKKRKPVILLAYTNMAAIEALVDSGAIPKGEWVQARGFGQLLERTLLGAMSFRVADPNRSTPTNIVRDTWRWREGTNTFYNTRSPSETADLEGSAWEEWKQAYYTTLEQIRRTDLAQMPLSPIDHMRERLEAEGIRVGEITGRSVMVETDGTRMRVVDRPEGTRAKKKTRDRFNAGELDCLIFNSAGATGISLHASQKFRDQNPRHMIVAQTPPNINDTMQAFGRINRLGQVERPWYTMVHTVMPPELRLATILERKMASLNANTSGSRKSAVSQRDIPDMMNKIGDKANLGWLFDNEDFAVATVGSQHYFDWLVGRPYYGSDGKLHPRQPAEDGYRIWTGKLMLAPVAEQRRYYEEMEDLFNRRLAILDEQGENPFVAKNYDLQAEVIDRKTLIEGPDDGSPLEQGVFLQTLSVLATRKPHNRAKLESLVADHQEGLDIEREIFVRFHAWNAELEQKLEAAAEYDIEAEKHNAEVRAKQAEAKAAKEKKRAARAKPKPQAARGDEEGREPEEDGIWPLKTPIIEKQIKKLEEDRQLIEALIGDAPAPGKTKFRIGQGYVISRDEAADQTVVLLQIDFPPHSAKRNTLKPDHIRLQFAVPSSKRVAWFTLAEAAGMKIRRHVDDGIPEGWDDLHPKGDREVRRAYTGNILKAVTEDEGGHNQVPQYREQEIATITYEDGSVGDVVLLPDYVTGQDMKRTRLLVPAEVRAKLKEAPLESDQKTRSGDPLVTLTWRREGYLETVDISVIGGGTLGRRIFNHEPILRLTEEKEFKSGKDGRRHATIQGGQLEALLGLLEEQGVWFSVEEDIKFGEGGNYDPDDDEDDDYDDSAYSEESELAADELQSATPKTPRIPPKALAGGRQKAPQQIIDDFARAVGHRIRIMRTGRRGAIGSYRPSDALLRIRRAGDVPTALHEIGHFLDDFFGLHVDGSFDIDLRGGVWGWGSQPPAGLSPAARRKYRRAERVAEFVRAWAINPDQARRAAPRFTAHFEQTVPKAVLVPLRQMSTEARQFYGLPAGEKILSNVARVQIAGEKAGEGIVARALDAAAGGHEAFRVNLWDRFLQAVQDDLRPFLKGARAAQGMRGIRELKPSEDPEKLARLYGHIRGKFLDITEHGMISGHDERKRTTPGGWRWLIEPARKDTAEHLQQDYDDMVVLLEGERVYEHAMGAADAGADAQQLREMGGFEGGFPGPTSLDIAGRAAFTDLQKDPVRYRRAREMARRYRQWADAVLRYQVAKGRLSPEAYTWIKAGNRYYAAMHITDEALEGKKADRQTWSQGAGGAKLGNVKDWIKTFHASRRMKEDPVANLLVQTERLMREADRNEVMVAVRNLLTRRRGMHDPNPQDLASIAAHVEGGTPGAVAIYKEGELEWWLFHEDIRVALKAFDGVPDLGLAGKILRGFASVFHGTVTHTPAFAIRNVIKDVEHRSVVSRGRGVGFRLPAGRWSAEEMSLFRRFGGSQFGWYAKGPANYKAMVRREFRKMTGDRLAVFLDVTADRYQRMVEASETAGRIGEFRRTVAETRKRHPNWSERDVLLEAGYQAADILDYAVAGRLVRVTRPYVPFLNASIQGKAKLAKAVAENPALVARRLAVQSMIFGVALYLAMASRRDWLRQWRQFNAYRKDGFDLVPALDDLWVAIPRNYEAGLAVAGVVRAADLMNGNRNAFEGFWDSVVAGVSPTSELPLGPAVGTIYEIYANRDQFTGRTIVPEYEQGISVPLRRGAQRASRIGKVASAALRQSVDPRIIDHGIASLFGNVGRTAVEFTRAQPTRTQIANAAVGLAVGTPGPGANDVVWVGRYFRRWNMSSGRQIPRFEAESMGLPVELLASRGAEGDQVNPIRDLAELKREWYASRNPRQRQAIAAKLIQLGGAVRRAAPAYREKILALREADNN